MLTEKKIITNTTMGMEKREEESEEQTQNGKIGRADHR